MTSGAAISTQFYGSTQKLIDCLEDFLALSLLLFTKGKRRLANDKISLWPLYDCLTAVEVRFLNCALIVCGDFN